MDARIGEFYKAGTREYDKFFRPYEGGDARVDELSKQLRKLNEELQLATHKLNEEYSKKYAQAYDKPDFPNILCYMNRQGTKMYYSMPDGQGIDESRIKPGSYRYNLDTKNGEVEVLAGFSFPLAAIITKTYKYAISADGSFVKLHLIGEQIAGFLEERAYNSHGSQIADPFSYSYRNPLDQVCADEFLSKLYGRELNTKFSFVTAKNRQQNNQSFEIICRTAPAEILRNLLNMNTKVAEPVHKLLHVEKSVYDQYVAEGYAADLVALNNYIINKDKYNKTPLEWLELIKECKKYEEDLDFYDINYGSYYTHGDKASKLLATLAESFNRYNYIDQYYSFGKFVRYIVDAVITQGYTNITGYVSDLSDYLSMCNRNNMKPNTETSYLKMVHDIASRNLSIKVSPDDEQKFHERYLGSKDVKVGDYVVVAPGTTSDILAEGNALNHCVASYIKKIIDDKCRIFFLRKDPTIPLVTLEIEGNAIVQARGASNRGPSEEEIKAIKGYADKMKLEVKY